MSKAAKVMLLVHGVVDVLFGLPLLLLPGRFLGVLGWAPIDPVLSRVLGAALLGFAWLQYRAWQAAMADCAVVFEMQAVFCILACVGLLRHLLFAGYPAVVWVLFAVLAAFAAASVLFIVTKVAHAPKP